MKLRNFFGIILIVYISIIQISTRDLYQNDDLFRQLRRRFFNKDLTSKLRRSAVDIGDRDCYGINCQSRFTNPDCSTNNCQPNICNTGQCISLKTTYYCECPSDRYGEHCEKYFYYRNISKRESFYRLFYQFKQVMNKQDMSGKNDKDERAYYDYKNGIYF